MQECCIFLNAFGSFSILTSSGPKFLYKQIVDVGAHSVRPWTFALLQSLRANNVRPYFSETVDHC